MDGRRRRLVPGGQRGDFSCDRRGRWAAGPHAVSLTYPPDADRSRQALESVFEDGLDRYQVDNRCVRVHTRELVWGTSDLSLVRDHRGRPGLAIAMVRDLTQMKRSEQERRGVFERLDGPSTTSGTGMGLAICRKIVELLDGSIGVHGGHAPRCGSCCRRRCRPAGPPAS